MCIRDRVYNEEKNIPDLIREIHQQLNNKFPSVHVVMVDDGSVDNTEQVINDIQKREGMNLTYIRLSRNHGKDLAIKCGMDYARGEICSIMDADLQHPPDKILEALEYLEQGYDIVHIVKKDYNFGPTYRKFASRWFNKFLNFLSGFEVHLTDFKVLNRKAVDRVKLFNESFFFGRGILDLIGLKYTQIDYIPRERKFGKSKYSLFSLIKLAINSMMAISIKPLRISIYVGLFISLFSFLFALYILFEKLMFGQPIPGFATLATSLFFLAGIQLLFLGVIGEYLGKTFIEAKRRPQYIIDYMKEI